MKPSAFAVVVLLLTAGLSYPAYATTNSREDVVVEGERKTATPGDSAFLWDLPSSGHLREKDENIHVLRGSSREWWSGEFRQSEVVEGAPVTNETRWVETNQADAPTALCGIAYECHEYTVRLEGHIDADSRLRVGLTNWVGMFTGDILDLVITTPGNQECRGADSFGAFHGVSLGLGAESYEAIVERGGADGCDEAPVAGDYTVHVLALQVSKDGDLLDREPYAPYRLRAALDRREPAVPNRLLVPDLRPDAPPWGFEFGCAQLDSPPSETTPDEHQDKDRICLRYFFSWGNFGAGLFDLRFNPVDTRQEVDLKQRVYWADGTPGRYEEGPDYAQAYEDYAVGTVHFHESHRHWHVSNYYTGQLFPIGPDGSFRDGRDAVKQGLCTTPHFMVDFDRIFHDDAHVPSTGCDLAEVTIPQLEEARIPLAAGWGDYYGSGNPDNFVDVTGMVPDTGESVEYVFRFTLNPDALDDLEETAALVESELDNNTAYAHIRITRDEDGVLDVCTIERGLGDDPWAPNASPVDSTGRAEMCD